jgi:cytochrome b pre-mRNA-processing protein 3
MLNILDWLRKRSPTGRTATKIYGSIVAQARTRSFYADWGIPDTAEGRYEMLVVHMFLVLEAMRDMGVQTAATQRALVEQFVTDVDDSLRQLAVGDMSVPRRVKKAAAGLKERTALYRAAIEADASEDALVEALADTIGNGKAAQTMELRALAAYMIASRQGVTISEHGMVAGFAPVTAQASHNT